MLKSKRCILIVDDEVKIVRAIKDFLKASGFSVLEAYDGEEALRIYYENSNHIDLILLDVMMPQKNGFEVLGEIRESFSVPVIMLTARGEEHDQVQGFGDGADDYVVKPFSPSLLLLRIEAILKRVGKDIEDEIILGELTVNIPKRFVKVKGVQVDLTRREFDLLNYFIVNKGITLNREKILNGVWGYEFEGEERTVDTHVKQLRAKLMECATYLKTVHRVGYIFEVEE